MDAYNFLKQHEEVLYIVFVFFAMHAVNFLHNVLIFKISKL